MTAVTHETSSANRRFAWASIVRLPLLIAGATLLSLMMNLALVHAVGHGGFADPDDAMRLVEVRAWMAGQSWFDVSALRLDPPTGASMHWSRLVDLPNALLIRLFGLVTPNAEVWDRVALPTLLLVGLYAGVTWLATLLLGRGAQLAALLGVLLSGATLVLFQPGRIGHHGPETVALVWAVALALSSLGAHARPAVIAGALVALSLAMSLETLPFLAALCTAMVVVWIMRGEALAPALLAFALGLGGTLPVVFLATVDPRNWFAPVCDALGAAHLGAGLIFATGSAGLASMRRVLQTWRHRLAGAAVVAGCAAVFIALASPACLHGPFAGVDPLVRDIWLDHVTESLPLLAFARIHPALGLAVALPTALGAAGSLWAARSLRGVAALRFGIVAGISAFGLAIGFWQVRVFASVMPLALCGGLYAVVIVRQHLSEARLRVAARLASFAILPFTATAWAVALPAGGEPAARGPSCLAPTALAPLKTLPPGRVVAPIDSGSYILEATANAVFSAPYHRNNDGNRFAMNVFLAPPADARALLAARHVTYVMTCAGLGDIARLAARSPNGLAARLEAGEVPSYLRPIPLAETPYRVYAVSTAP